MSYRRIYCHTGVGRYPGQIKRLLCCIFWTPGWPETLLKSQSMTIHMMGTKSTQESQQQSRRT